MKQIKYEKLRVYKYILTETVLYAHTGLFKDVSIDTEWYSISENYVGVKKQYMWDGPSGPAVDTESLMLASVLHDAAYQAHREGKLSMEHRKQSDLLFYQSAIAGGVSRIRANYMYYALRMFGKKAATKGLAEQR